MKTIRNLLIIVVLGLVSCKTDQTQPSSSSSTPKPKASFSHDYDGKTKSPVTIYFANNSINAKKSIWNFDNGEVLSTNSKMVYSVFNKSGIYAVKLSAIGEPGDTSVEMKFISVR